MTKIATGSLAVVVLTLTAQDPAAAQGAWEAKVPMSTPRAGPAAAELNGKLHVLGGFPTTPTCQFLSTHEVYDPASTSWTPRAAMPTPRAGHGVGVLNGVLYVVGGHSTCGNPVATVDAYDPSADSWSARQPMPTRRGGVRVGVVNGVLYALGGSDDFNVFATVEAYDPASDSWSTKSPMPTPRTVHTVEVIDGILYVVGGQNHTGALATVDAYNPATDTWSTKRSMPAARNYVASGVINGRLFAVGGYGPTGPTATVNAYDPSTDTWSAQPDMPSARAELAAATVNGVLFALGGWNGSAILATNEAFTPTPVLTEAWVSRFAPGPWDAYNYSAALTVDAQGNVYVTGPRVGVGGLDWATIKYGRDGTQIWARSYDGPGHGWDGSAAIAVDSTGNVFVGGASIGETTGSDYTIVKYDANGIKLAEVRHNNNCPDGRAGADWIRDLALDAQGNVYVTGGSEFCPGYPTFGTLKFNSNLTPLWVALEGQFVFAPGADLAVDSQGNVHVTGYRAGPGGWDYFTVKYDGSSGAKLWEATYNGPNMGVDLASGVAVDAGGSVYVTGYSDGDSLTIKYTAAGAVAWERRYPGFSTSTVAMDSLGNVYVSGGVTIKYDTNGNQLWVSQRGGSMALDSAGNVYLTTTGLWPYVDYITVSLDTNGQQTWMASYNGPVNYLDFAHDIAVDGQGNAYVTGYSYGTCCVEGTSVEFATIRYGVAAPPNASPVADAGPDQIVILGEAALLDGSASRDPDGSLIRFTWTFGDGGSGVGATVNHTYLAAGTFVATLEVTDDQGATAMDSAIVTVQTPGQAIAALSGLVQSFNFAQGIANSLDAKLQNVREALDAANSGQRNDAANKLQAFINAVEAQRGKEITNAQADTLIAQTNRILATL